MGVAAVIAALGAGCAKGSEIPGDGLIYLDPRRPTPGGMDASAEAGADPPVEVPPESTPDAAAAPPDASLPGPDAGDPPVILDAGSDASSGSDAG